MLTKRPFLNLNKTFCNKFLIIPKPRAATSVANKIGALPSRNSKFNIILAKKNLFFLILKLLKTNHS